MRQTLKFCFAFFALAASAFLSPAWAQATEKRVALVIGNAAYQAKPLETPANDAGLIAQTLQAAGFDVSGARDLDEDSLRHAFRDFVEKVSASGPDTVAFVYFAGYGLQLEGENYLAPIDVAAAAAAPSRSVHVSDFSRPLAALRLKFAMIVLDAARQSPFSVSGQPLAGGLALLEPGADTMVAFNAAPGTVAPDEKGPYGAYAQALAEMIRAGGLSPADVFERVRLRVNETTKGAEVPWNSAKVETSFVFFERSAEAPPPPVSPEQTAALRTKPIRSLGAKDGYLAAVERDTLPAYEEFIASYPNDPLAKRVRAIAAARREALFWRRVRAADTQDAYWTYLRRYPNGPHAWDARRRLEEIAAALEPPSSFVPVDYDVPPPPPEETAYVDRPALAFNDFAFAPPPPVYFLPPPEFVVLPPPVVFFEPFILPIPVFVPIPFFVNPPFFVAAPVDNFVFNNIHNTIIVNNNTNIVTVTNQSGQVVQTTPLRTAAGGAPTIGASLPPTVARKAQQIAPGAASRPGTAPGAFGGAPAHGPGGLPLPIPGKGQPAPGALGHGPPLVPGRPGAPPAGVSAPSAPTAGKPGAPSAGAAPSSPTARAPSPGEHKLPTPPALGKPGAPSTGAASSSPTARAPSPGEHKLPTPPALGKPGAPPTGALAPSHPTTARGPSAAMRAPSRMASPRAPRAAPHFAPPRAAPRFAPPRAAPRFAPPRAAPRFAPPRAASHFAPPRAAPRFAAPRAAPRFAAPRAGPGFAAPRAGPGFAAPRAGPGFAAPRAGPGFAAPRAGPGFAAPRAGPGFQQPH